MSSPVGSIVSAFGSNEIVPQYYNKKVNKNLDYLGGKFRKDNKTLTAGVDDFTAASKAAKSAIDANAAKSQSDYDALYNENRNYNPLDTYERLRSGNLGALKDYSGQLEDAGSRNDKLALAALGMAGRPDSSYGTILRSDRVSRNLAPVLGNIMSSLGSDTATIGSERSNNLGNLVDLIGRRTMAPMAGYGMELDPGNALMALRGSQTGLLGQQAGVAKDNTAGFSLKPDTISKIGTAMNNFNDSVWQNAGNLMSVYSSMYGGGMGGGGGIKTGNASGGGYPQTSGAISGSFGGGGGGGGGSGMNTSQLMQLFKMFQGGGGMGGAAGGGGVPASTGNTVNSSTYGGMVNPNYQQPSYQSYDPWGNYSAGF